MPANGRRDLIRRLKVNIRWLLCVPPFVTFGNSAFCPYSLPILEQTMVISLYSIDWLLFRNETDSVYCAVRNAFLTIIRVKRSIWRVKCKTLTVIAFIISHHFRLHCRPADPTGCPSLSVCGFLRPSGKPTQMKASALLVCKTVFCAI